MDKKDSKIRPSKTTGRRVVKSEYDWDAFDRRTDKSLKNGKQEDEGRKNIHLLTEAEIKKRYHKQQRHEQLKTQRIRAILVFFSAVAFVIILVFMTPIFNIRSISVAGNRLVTLQEIDACISDLMGENLFKTGSEKIKNRLKSIAYIEDAEISKRIFPPSVKITVREYKPAGYININGFEVIINSDLKVLDDKNSLPTDKIPEITGVNTDKYTVGKPFKTDSAEKDEILKTCLSVMEQIEILGDVNAVDVANTTGIEFEYQNRINVLCGTQLDLSRKINLFRETIFSNNIADDAKGTIDLSVTGKAVYTP